MEKHNFVAVTFSARLLPFMIYGFKYHIKVLPVYHKKDESGKKSNSNKNNKNRNPDPGHDPDPDPEKENLRKFADQN